MNILDEPLKKNLKAKYDPIKRIFQAYDTLPKPLKPTKYTPPPPPCIVRANCGQSEIKHVLASKLLSPCYKRIGSIAFSCAYIELWKHLGSLESTQEARVALGCRLEQLLRFFRDFQTSRVHP